MKFIKYYLPIILLYFIIPSQVKAASVSLQLFPKDLTLEKNQEQIVVLKLDPAGKQSKRVDINFRFDASALQVIEITNLVTDAQVTANSIDNIDGSAKFGVFNQKLTTKNDIELIDIAKIKIKAIKPTIKTALTMDFISGKTNDSNVLNLSGQDILATVSAANITINQQSPSALVKQQIDNQPINIKSTNQPSIYLENTDLEIISNILTILSILLCYIGIRLVREELFTPKQNPIYIEE